MSRRRGKRGRAGGGTAAGARSKGRRTKQAPTPWRERARDVLRRLRDFAREREGPAIEEHLREHFGDDAASAEIADLQRAFDDYVCTPGSAGDARSLVRAFAEETEELSTEERAILPKWEAERSRRVYLLDRGYRDRLELWDPLAGGRVVLHLIEKMPNARVAALKRGTVVIASAVPWGKRKIAMGQVEIYDDDEAIELYRREVRQEERAWHELPPATPIV